MVEGDGSEQIEWNCRPDRENFPQTAEANALNEQGRKEQNNVVGRLGRGSFPYVVEADVAVAQTVFP